MRSFGSCVCVCVCVWGGGGGERTPCTPPPGYGIDAYLVSLEPQTFGFRLDSCPDALSVSQGDLDASSPIFFLITYTHY